MNEESAAPPAVPEQEPIKKPDATWLRALGVMRRNPRATLLPIAVTQLPFAVLTAAVFFYLFYSRYPSAEFESFNWLSEAPNGLRLTMVSVGAAQSLFSLIGAAATMVSVSAIRLGKPIGLAQSLDPAFTRMGGLLLIGAIFYSLVLASAFGIIVLLYFLVRFGLAIQIYVVDGKTVTGSFRESWGLLRGRMFAFMGVLFATVPFAFLVLFVTTLLLSIAVAPFGTDPGRTTELVLQSGAIFVVGVLLVPIAAYVAISTTIFYLNAKEQADA